MIGKNAPSLSNIPSLQVARQRNQKRHLVRPIIVKSRSSRPNSGEYLVLRQGLIIRELLPRQATCHAPAVAWS